jgi:hypothetical protein
MVSGLPHPPATLAFPVWQETNQCTAEFNDKAEQEVHARLMQHRPRSTAGSDTTNTRAWARMLSIEPGSVDKLRMLPGMDRIIMESPRGTAPFFDTDMECQSVFDERMQQAVAGLPLLSSSEESDNSQSTKRKRSNEGYTNEPPPKKVVKRQSKRTKVEAAVIASGFMPTRRSPRLRGMPRRNYACTRS